MGRSKGLGYDVSGSYDDYRMGFARRQIHRAHDAGWRRGVAFGGAVGLFVGLLLGFLGGA